LTRVDVARGQAVGAHQRIERNIITLGDAAQGVAGLHDVAGPIVGRIAGHLGRGGLEGRYKNCLTDGDHGLSQAVGARELIG